MGLLKIFGKKTSSIGGNDSLRAEFFNLDLSALLGKSAIYNPPPVSGLEHTGVDYECALDIPVLKAFDTIRIGMGSEDKETIHDPDIEIVVTFLCKGNLMTMQQMVFIVNSVAEICKMRNEYWTNFDERMVNSGLWTGRNLFIGDYCYVRIDLDDHEGVILCIVGFKEFLRELAVFNP